MDGDLGEFVAAHYGTSEYPALADQVHHWRATTPLAGVQVLDATPVYRNTLPKYLALQAAGAQVSVGLGHGIPADAAVLSRLPDFGISVATEEATARGFDVVLDCAGGHAHVPSRFGYAELTRSGVAHYAHCPAAVLVVDSGLLKRIETTLGTGDGFVRAMSHLGQPVGPGRNVIVFGGGKVGLGVVIACLAAGASVTVVDPAAVPLPASVRWVDAADHEAIEAAIASAWCVVSATGKRDGLANLAAHLTASEALLANMGAEDEFGATVASDRVLHGKVPVNFALAEPTRLRYLDPTLALSNAAALALVRGEVPAGVHSPPAALEAAILQQVRDHGAVAPELAHVIAPASASREEVR